MPANLAIPSLLKTAEVAKILHVNRSTVFRMIAAGLLPQPIRFNSRFIRFRAEDINNYISQNAIPPSRRKAQ
jgi:excisionase family DNA binding protein